MAASTDSVLGGPERPGNDERAGATSRRVAAWMAGGVGAIGLIGVVGWLTETQRLFHWASWSGWEGPSGALGMVACAVSLWLQIPRQIPRWRHRTSLVLSIATGAIALLACLETFRGVDLEVDDILFPIGLPYPEYAQGSHSTSGAAMTLLCASLSLLLLRTRSLAALCVSTVGTSSSLILSLTALFGYSLNVAPDSPFWRVFGMGLQTAAGFLVLGCALIAGRPDRPFIATIMSPHAGGVMARRILPVAIGLPILLAMMQMVGEQSGAVTAASSVALRVSLFVSVQTIVVLFSAYALNRTDQQRLVAEESRRLMMDELDHRVKNTLASIAAVCEQTLATSTSLESFGRAFMGRIHAMARAHEALALNRWDGVSVRELIETTVAPFVARGTDRVRLEGEEMVLPAAAALPVAATLHELATNAAKYGALSNEGGGIDVEWTSPSGGGTSIRWTERNGKGRPQGGATAVHSGGFGTTLIRGLVAHELKGSTDLEIDESGVRCSIFVPPHVADARVAGRAS